MSIVWFVLLSDAYSGAFPLFFSVCVGVSGGAVGFPAIFLGVRSLRVQVDGGTALFVCGLIALVLGVVSGGLLTLGGGVLLLAAGGVSRVERASAQV